MEKASDWLFSDVRFLDELFFWAGSQEVTGRAG